MCMSYTQYLSTCLFMHWIWCANGALENSFFKFIMCRGQKISEQMKNLLNYVCVCECEWLHKREFDPSRCRTQYKQFDTPENWNNFIFVPHTHKWTKIWCGQKMPIVKHNNERDPIVRWRCVTCSTASFFRSFSFCSVCACLKIEKLRKKKKSIAKGRCTVILSLAPQNMQCI